MIAADKLNYLFNFEADQPGAPKGIFISKQDQLPKTDN